MTRDATSRHSAVPVSIFGLPSTRPSFTTPPMPTPDADPPNPTAVAATASAPWADACAVYFVVTMSGSCYLVAETRNGRWWFVARNVAHTRSRTVPVGIWEIARPNHWPPALGESLLLLARKDMRRDDPARVLGGGKRTAVVIAAEPLPPEQWVAECETEDRLRKARDAETERTAVGINAPPRYRIRLS